MELTSIQKTPSSSSVSSSTPRWAYDVFLSFHKGDTRTSFIGQLLAALKRKGILVFKDDEELHDLQLLKPIQESQFAVIVLSEHYSSSTSCLTELTNIVECKKQMGLTILPVFYHVDPYVVRKQKESFADHAVKEEQVKSWRAALEEVASVPGWHIHYDRLVPTVVEEIIMQIEVSLSHKVSNTYQRIDAVEDNDQNLLLQKQQLRPEETINFTIAANSSILFPSCIQLHYIYLKQLWNGWKSFNNITHINLSCLQEASSFPDLASCSSLVNVGLSGCSRLLSLDLSAYSRLVSLDLSACSRLNTLDLSACSRLQNLYLFACSRLKTLDLSACLGLVSLDLSACSRLNTLDLSACSKLQSLYLFGCSRLEILKVFGSGLEILKLFCCSRLEILILSGCSGLRILNLSGCTRLETLKVYGCTRLEILKVFECAGLEILKFFDCTGLEILNLSRCSRFKVINLSGSLRLEILNSSGCLRLQNLNLSGCSRLQSLNLSGCSRLESLNLSRCSRLQNLNLSGCSRLKNLNLSGCSRLQSLNLSDSSELKSLNLVGCSRLQNLNLSGCSRLKNLNLSGCSRLQSLNLSDSSELKSLNLVGCSRLVSLELLANSRLGNLFLIAYSRHESLDPSACSRLEVHHCPSLKIPKLGRLVQASEYLSESGGKEAIKKQLTPETPGLLFEIEAADLKLKSVERTEKRVAEHEAPRKDKKLEIEESRKETETSDMDLEEYPNTVIQRDVQVCLMQGGLGLKEPPKDELWENVERICLMDNELSILPKNPKCHALLALFLQRNYTLRIIPPSFFNDMSALQILNLSRTSIRSLPESIIELVSLKRLFLNECHCFMMLSPKVGELKRLEVLDLEGTDILKLPKEIKELTNLTCLKVSLYSYSEDGGSDKQSDLVIHSDVISTLSHLEELSIYLNPDDKWWIECVGTIVTEICSLKSLDNLEFCFPGVELVSQFLSNSSILPSLSHFKFIVGQHVKRILSRLPHDVEFELEQSERCLKYINGVAVPEEIKKLLQYSTAFFLERHAIVTKLSEFGIRNMEKLQCCVVGECNEVEVIIDEFDSYEEDDEEEDEKDDENDETNANEEETCEEDDSSEIGSTSFANENILGSLKYLYIYCMKNLKRIWGGPVEVKCFSLLQSLTLRTCPKLITIFTIDLLENLYNLEELIVEDCPSVATLVSYGVSTDNNVFTFFPNLKRILLHYMPGLVTFSNGSLITPKLEWMSFYNCPNLKSLPIQEVYSKHLRKVKGEESWWEALEWRNNRPAYLGKIFVPIN